MIILPTRLQFNFFTLLFRVQSEGYNVGHTIVNAELADPSHLHKVWKYNYKQSRESNLQTTCIHLDSI